MTQSDRDLQLIHWRESIRRTQAEPRLRVDMEDVAQAYVMKLLQQEQDGMAVPIWPGYLPDDTLKKIRQIARSEYDVVLEPFEDRIQQPLSDPSDIRMGEAALRDFEKIKTRFTKAEIEQMLRHCAEQPATQKSLAEAAEIPYRTLKDRFSKLRALA